MSNLHSELDIEALGPVCYQCFGRSPGCPNSSFNGGTTGKSMEEELKKKFVSTAVIAVSSLSLGLLGATVASGEAAAAQTKNTRCGNPWVSGKTGRVTCTGIGSGGGAFQMWVDCPNFPDPYNMYSLKRGETRTVALSCPWGSARGVKLKLL